MLCKKTDWTNFLLDYFKERKINIVMNPRINLHKASLYIKNIFTTLKIQKLKSLFAISRNIMITSCLI